jgi:hypothetical protein
MLAELVGHELFDDAFGRAALLIVRVLKTDAHAGRRLVRRLLEGRRPDDTAAQAHGFHELGDGEREDELGADVERLVGANERAALGNVLRVIGEEGVEPLVLDLQFDGLPIVRPPVGLRALRGH